MFYFIYDKNASDQNNIVLLRNDCLLMYFHTHINLCFLNFFLLIKVTTIFFSFSLCLFYFGLKQMFV